MTATVISPRGFLARFLVLALLSGVTIGMTKVGNTLLGLHLGAEPWQSNLILAAETAGMVLITIPAGFLIARLGPQPVYLASSLVAAAAYVASPWLTAWWHLALLGVLTGICVPFRVVSMSGSFLSRLKELGAEKSGWYRGALMTGTLLLGPLIGGALLDHLGVTVLYAIASVCFLIMGFGGQFVLPERVSQANPATIPSTLNPLSVLSDLRTLTAIPPVRRSLALEFTGGLTGGFFVTFAIILGLHGFKVSPSEAVLPVVSQGIAYALTLFLGGHLLRWLSVANTYRLSQLLVILGLLTIGLTQAFNILFVGAALLGAGLAIQHLTNVSVISRSEVDKGRISGVFTFAGMVGNLLGLLASAGLSHFLSLQAVFLAWIPLFLALTWNAVQLLPVAERARAWPAQLWRGLRAAGGGIAVGLGFLLLWHVATRNEWVERALIVPPAAVWDVAVEMIQNGLLWENIQASLVRVGLGFGSGALAGLVFGILYGIWRPLRTYTSFTFETIRQIPTIAWIPLLMIFLGLGEGIKIVVIGLGVFFPVALATIDGVAGVPKRYLEVADVLRFSPWTRITRVIIPATLPDLATGMRIALSRAWMLIVAAELYGADSGLGQLMDSGRQQFQMDLLLLALLTTGIIGLSLDGILALIERRFLSWKRAATF